MNLLGAPDQLLAIAEDRVWTAAEVAELAGRVAAALGPAERCLLRCEGRVGFTAALLACLHSGRRVVLPASAAPAAIAAAGADLVLHDGAGGDLDLRTLAPAPPIWPCEPPAGRVFLTLTTSGSTGEPKQVDKTVGQLFGEARLLAQTFAIDSADVIVASVPPMHIYGLLFGVLVPLVSGAVMTDDTPAYPDTIAGRLARASVLVSVPTQLRALASVTSLSRPPRVVFSSGGPLLPSTAEALETLGVEPIEVLGSTETGGIAWRQQRRDPRWTPMPGVVVSAVEGRMFVDSPFLAPDAPRPWAADDAVEMDGARFHHLGRVDDVVKVAGRRVSLAAVIRALLDDPDVRDATVLALPDEARGTALHALVVCEDEAAVRGRLRERLDPLPRLHRVPGLPREPNGKLPMVRVRALLDSLLPQPLVVDDQVATGLLPFPPDHPSTRGHFPGQPLIPGAALLEAMARAAAGVWPGRPARVEVATFTRPVLPGTAPALTLRREPGRVRAELRDGELLAQATFGWVDTTSA